MNLEGYLLKVKALITQKFTSVVMALLLFLAGLLYVTTYLSHNYFLSETFIDISIYFIYLLLLSTLSLLAFSVYIYYTQEEEIEVVGYYLDATDDAEETKEEVNVVDFEKLFVSKKPAVTYRRVHRGFDYFEAGDAEKMALFLSFQHPKITATLFSVCDLDVVTLVSEQLTPEYLEMVDRCDERTQDQGQIEALDKTLEMELHPHKKLFELIEKLQPQEVQAILRVVDKKELAFALLGLSQSLQERFFANMSPQTVETFKKVLIQLSGIQEKKITRALEALFLLAKQLKEDGKMREQNQPTGSQ